MLKWFKDLFNDTTGLSTFFSVVDLTLDGYAMLAGKNAADVTEEEYNEWLDEQHEHAIENWQFNKDQTIRNHDWATKVIQNNIENENRFADFQDAANLSKFTRQLKIRNMQQTSNEQAYSKSNQIYETQISFNDIAAQAAREDEYRKLQEIHAESTFDVQEKALQQLIEQGREQAKGRLGGSTKKVQQSSLASYGRQVAMINESLESAGRNTRAVLEEIKRDKFSADLAAYANKMLDPGIIPFPILPDPVPRTEYIFPTLTDEDFGPMPIRGQPYQGISSKQYWIENLGSLAGKAANIDWS